MAAKRKHGVGRTRRNRRGHSSGERLTLATWKRRVSAIQAEISELFHGPLPRNLESIETVRTSLRVANLVLNGLSDPERHDPGLIEKLHNVARGGNLYSSGSADLVDAALHVRTIKLVWPEELADGVRERLAEYGTAFADETSERIEHLLRDADPENLRTFSVPIADLIMGAWVRAGRPTREASSSTFHLPIEPKTTDARTRRALLMRILNAIARHEQVHPHASERSRAQ